MYKIFSKIFLSLTFVLTGFLFFSIDKVEAACVVNQANFRVVGPTGNPISISPNDWYTDVNPPFVYIDFQTSGCGSAPSNVFVLNVMELDDADGLININDNPVTNLTNKSITVPPGTSNITVALRAGDDECDSPTSHSFQCEYYITISPPLATPSSSPLPYIVGGANDFNATSHLAYNCDSGCDNKNWEYITILQTYQGTHPDDIAMQNAADGNGANQPISTGGTNININIQNPIGENTMTLVDFIDKVIKFALTIGIPIIAIAIIYSGLLFVTARGNDAQLETAKNAFTYAVIGGAILLGSWIFAKLIKETIESIVMIITYYG